MNGSRDSHSCCSSRHMNCQPGSGRVESLQIFITGDHFTDGKIPSQLCDLTNLRKLTLGSLNSLSEWDAEIPSCLERLEALEELHVYDTTRVPNSIVQKIATLKGLKKLTLQSAGVQAAGFNHIFNLKDLEYLSVAVNNLSATHIRADLCSLTKLLYLDLSSNQLSGVIPHCLSSLYRLQHVELGENKLEGTIPHLGNLTSLQRLEIPRNHLTGPLPASICNISASLKVLDLSKNHITSQLPDCEFAMSTLILHHNSLHGILPHSLLSSDSIDLSWNYFTGPVPRVNRTRALIIILSSNLLTGSLEHLDWNLLCPSLSVLDLSMNHLEGSIPPGIANCTKLKKLNLGNNRLNGEIPANLGAITGMLDFRVSDNQLHGEIPGTIGNWTYLVTLDLRNNSFSGVLGSWIYDLKFMKILGLGSNKIGGSIPRKLGNFSYELMAVDLSQNRFRGSLPEPLSFSVSEIPFLTWAAAEVLQIPFMQNIARKEQLYNNYLFGQAYLDFSGNMLDGIIPASIGSVKGVVYINLSQNQLSGQIPNAIGNLFHLKALDLSGNNLSGTIPAELKRLTQLSYFNVSGNNLSGPIPQGSQFNTFLEDSYFGNPHLCGFPLESCSIGNNVSRITDGTTADHHLQQSVHLIVAPVAAASALILLLFGFFHARRKQLSKKQVPSLSILEGELWHATKGYNTQNVIGVGGCSTVYRGESTDGKVVPIKVYKAGEEDFLREYNILRDIKHRNIIRLLNCSFEANVHALVLEYMENGSLDKQLHELQGVKLPWEARLNIATGVANALCYLHEEATSLGPIIHRDLKPDNIFLDQHMEARLGDFGISTRLNVDADQSDNKFKGSIGYVAPEYAFNGAMTTAGDVYSYGIVLLEMLTGIRPTRVSLRAPSLRSLVKDNPVDGVLDPMLRQEASSCVIARRSILNVIRIGLECSRENPAARPRMKEIAAELEALVTH